MAYKTATMNATMHFLLAHGSWPFSQALMAAAQLNLSKLCDEGGALGQK